MSISIASRRDSWKIGTCHEKCYLIINCSSPSSMIPVGFSLSAFAASSLATLPWKYLKELC